MLRIVKPEEITDPGLLERYYESLTADEQAHLARFQPSDRHTRLVARATLRHALAEQVPGVAPSDFRFRVNAFGKPYLDGPEAALGLQFNISHCNGLIAVLISGHHLDDPAGSFEVGVDVERLRPLDDVLALARRFFAPPEVADLEGSPESERLQRFFRYWTLKESYVKARGQGISLGLSRFWFDLHPAPRIHFADGFEDHSSRWAFHQEPVGGRHWLATAREIRKQAQGVNPGPGLRSI